ncbi:MAG: regulator of chromosome condensation [Polyangiaceae bacterium]|jgi:alpha-tubulin suppressor-like RCC1 family protein|nr:regulator of chromosome condensation [Polyangiaceae bacterium]
MKHVGLDSPRLPRGAAAGLFCAVAVLGLSLVACERSKSASAVASSSSASAAGSRSCVAQLTGLGTYTCALLASGQARCWGLRVPVSDKYLNVEPLTLQGYPQKLSRLFANFYTLCATAADGSLWCGGGSSQGQLTHLRTDAPTKQPQLQPFRDVLYMTQAGRCLLTQTELRCWEHRQEPRPVTGLPAKPIQLVGDHEYACVLLENGQVFCRGANLRGELGILRGATEEERINSRIYKYVQFTRVSGLGDDTRLIASNSGHSCALKRDGSVWCWGQNDRGQVGKGDVSKCIDEGRKHFLLSNCTPEEGLEPSRVEGLPSDISKLSLGQNTSCAIDARGGAWCWGFVDAPTPKPIKLNVGAPVESVTVGENFCALLRDGQVRCQAEQPLSDWSRARTISLGCD